VTIQSVKRFINKLRGSPEKQPCAAMVTAPGEEAQTLPRFSVVPNKFPERSFIKPCVGFAKVANRWTANLPDGSDSKASRNRTGNREDDHLLRSCRKCSLSHLESIQHRLITGLVQHRRCKSYSRHPFSRSATPATNLAESMLHGEAEPAVAGVRQSVKRSRLTCERLV
jgi:hypothetical protein